MNTAEPTERFVKNRTFSYFHKLEEADEEAQEMRRLGWETKIAGDHMHGFVVYSYVWEKPRLGK